MCVCVRVKYPGRYWRIRLYCYVIPDNHVLFSLRALSCKMTWRTNIFTSTFMLPLKATHACETSKTLKKETNICHAKIYPLFHILQGTFFGFLYLELTADLLNAPWPTFCSINLWTTEVYCARCKTDVTESCNIHVLKSLQVASAV